MYRIEKGAPARMAAKGVPARQRDGASPPATAEPRIAGAAKSDHAGLTPEAGRQRAEAFVNQAKDRLVHLQVEELQATATECSRILTFPGLTKETESRVHLVAAAAHGLLARKRVDRRANASKAFREVRTAYDLAPDGLWSASGYGRALLALDNLNWFLKKLASSALGVDLKAESRRVVASLAAHQADPMAAVLRMKLADVAKDRKARTEAESALRALEARDPQAVRKAFADLAGDAEVAAAAREEAR